MIKMKVSIKDLKAVQRRKSFKQMVLKLGNHIQKTPTS